MKYDSEIGFAIFMLVVIFGGAGIVWLYAYISNNYSKADLKQIFWDNTPMGWGWKQLFGEKKKAKQAPPVAGGGYYTNQFGHKIPAFRTAPPPPIGRIGNGGNSGRLTSMKPAPKGFIPKAFSTSSLNVPPPISHIGKPLTIQNWDRITGFKVDVLGRSWFVVQAIHTGSGYECILESRSTHHMITFCIYDIMYDSHQVTVFCKGRVARLDVSVCKDPQLLLDKVAYEFPDKFDV